jgi:hypothetical protein
MRVVRGRNEVISSSGLTGITIDGRFLLPTSQKAAEVNLLHTAADKVLIQTKGTFENDAGQSLDFTDEKTFYNDGVVVTHVRLVPNDDFAVRHSIVWHVSAQGRFTSYLHKRRDEDGSQAARGKLPASGPVQFSTLTSCLGVVSPAAALAIFTDSGAMHLSRASANTAVAAATNNGVELSQYIAQIAPGDPPFILKAGAEFSFRAGISVASNRLPNPRTPELRMFIWIGDAKFPYPTDEEITQVAHWGYTMFQLHRVGTLGEPRPPAGELERVIRKVHELGMLFLWEENADLMYAQAPGVRMFKAHDQWSRWQGFTYDGHYQAKMDPYCDLVGTCLASPNGLAEYRLGNINRMLDRFPVDGIYLDDNLGYANCRLQKEHDHPQKVYDCLIELHEINWRRRELLHQRVPHAVLVSHNTGAFVLPLIADFDVQYFAEGYCFDSMEDYWDNYRAWSLSMNAQAMICPGDDWGGRCTASLACNYDMLTGGGQYSQMDWRLFPKKFHYATGVNEREREYCKTYNLAGAYFGLSEAKPWYFAEATNLFRCTAPQSFATVYQHRDGNDWLLTIANMETKPQTTSLVFDSPESIGIDSKKDYLLFDVHQARVKPLQDHDLNDGFRAVSIPAQALQLYHLRSHVGDDAAHLWGGKRLSETWHPRRHQLTVELQGPPGLTDTAFFWVGDRGVKKVLVDGKEARFLMDSSQHLVHGPVTFTHRAVKVQVLCSEPGSNLLPVRSAAPDPLGLKSE